MINTTEFAYKVYWHVTGTSEDVVSKDKINPIYIQLIAMIIYIIVTECFNKNIPALLNRRRLFFGMSPIGRIADEIRLSVIVRSVLNEFDLPRTRGDVVAIKNAIIEIASELSDEDIRKIAGEYILMEI